MRGLGGGAIVLGHSGPRSTGLESEVPSLPMKYKIVHYSPTTQIVRFSASASFEAERNDKKKI